MQDAACNSWGGSSEDRIAYLMAHVKTGTSPYQTPEVQQAQAYLERLQAVARYAKQFRQAYEIEKGAQP